MTTKGKLVKTTWAQRSRPPISGLPADSCPACGTRMREREAKLSFSVSCARDSTTYDYDSLGNLRHVILSTGSRIDYVIDGINRRIGKTVNGVPTEGYLYDDRLRPAAWLDGAGAVKAIFVYGMHVNVPDYMSTPAGTFRIITDQIGSPRFVIDMSSGAVVQRLDYDSFGQVLQDTGPGFQPFGFSGGIWDSDTKLVKFGARDYDPALGRWTTADPMRVSGGLNLYAYADNDPVNHTDPSGLTTWPGSGPVASRYGPRNGGFHYGIDIRNPMGGAVVASDAGTVISTTNGPHGEHQVIILNEDGSVSGYAHVTQRVTVGDHVDEGEVIGWTDMSGLSTGPHVHYSFRDERGEPKVDPMDHFEDATPYPQRGPRPHHRQVDPCDH